MEITLVEKNNRGGEHHSIYIDGNFAFSISEEDYCFFNLYEKRDISREEVEEIRKKIDFRAAKASAVRHLSLKYRSEYEVRQKLALEGYSQDTIEYAVSELKSLGYINDKIFAQKFVYDRSKLKPKSKKMLAYELQKKGVPSEVVAEVFSDWQMDDADVGIQLIRKKFGKYDLADEKILKKIHSFLKHRGFNFETINGIINSLNEKL